MPLEGESIMKASRIVIVSLAWQPELAVAAAIFK
jgi:hypothetical protein